MGVKVLNKANDSVNTVYPWINAVAYRNNIKPTTALGVWNLHTGQIVNLKSKPGTKAAEYVTPSGVVTDKAMELINEMEMERKSYLMQTGNVGKNR